MYIIVPVHNRSKITNNFVENLVKQTYSQYHLLLVDDGCKDDTVASVSNKIKNLTVIKGDGNLWWAGAVQKGYEWLFKNGINDNEIILVTNDDIIFNEKYLENGIREMEKTYNSFLIASYKNTEKPDVLFSLNENTGKIINKSEKNFVPNCFSMNSVFFRFKYLYSIGTMKPKILPHYLADIEFSFRAMKKGYKVIQNNNLQIYRIEETTGIHDISKSNKFDFFKSVFSNKYAGNPIHWTYFFYLTVKRKYLIFIVMFFWIKLFLKFSLILFTPIKKK